MGVPIDRLIDKAQSKTFSNDFDIQLDTVEKLYGQNIKFNFNQKDIEEIIAKEEIYPKEIKDRVYEIIMNQYRKYHYLFN